RLFSISRCRLDVCNDAIIADVKSTSAYTEETDNWPAIQKDEPFSNSTPFVVPPVQPLSPAVNEVKFDVEPAKTEKVEKPARKEEPKKVEEVKLMVEEV